MIGRGGVLLGKSTHRRAVHGVKDNQGRPGELLILQVQKLP